MIGAFRRFICSFLLIAFVSCTIMDDFDVSSAPPQVFSSYGRSLLQNQMQRDLYDYLYSAMPDYENAYTCSTRICIRIPVDTAKFQVDSDTAKLIARYIVSDNFELYTTYISAVREVSTNALGYADAIVIQYTKTPSFSDVQDAKEIIDKKLAEIRSQITIGMSEYDIVKLAYTEVIRMTDYGMSSSEPDNIYGVFVEGRALCDGIAKALTYVLTQLGIMSVYIVGKESEDDTAWHAWNKIKVDGAWYNADPTWDMPLTPGSQTVFFDYFLKGDDEFLKDHYVAEISQQRYNAVPESSKTDYK